jgi:hypothetical protein
MENCQGKIPVTCLSSWKGKLLSIEGRLVLINSVLSNMVLYMLYFLLLPKGVLNRLDFFRSRFFWQVDDTKQVCQVGTPSAECCSKSKFSPRGKLRVNIKLSRNSWKSTCRSAMQNNSSFLCPQLHRVVVKHKVWM